MPGRREPARIVLGVSGGIAAYKAVEVCRRLVDAGAHVMPVLTDDAQRFVGALTFSALASEPARTALFGGPGAHRRPRSGDPRLVRGPAFGAGRAGDRGWDPRADRPGALRRQPVVGEDGPRDRTRGAAPGRAGRARHDRVAARDRGHRRRR